MIKYLTIKKLAILLTSLIAGLSSGATKKSDTYEVLRVIDGDTLEIRMLNLPRELEKVKVRVAGIDTPETTYRAACPEELRLGKQATSFVRQRIDGAHITFKIHGWGKFARILADVYVDGESLRNLLIEEGLGVPYDGKKKSNPWCN